MKDFEVLLFTTALLIFTAWLSYLTNVLRNSLRELEHKGIDTQEISEAIEISQKALAAIWENMPTMDRIQELVPQFHLNQQESSGAAFFDFIGKYFMDDQSSLHTPEVVRDSAGRYGTTKEIQEITTTQSEADAESITSN